MATPETKAVTTVGFPTMIVQWALGEWPLLQAKPTLHASIAALLTLLAVYLAARMGRRSATSPLHAA